MICPPGNGLYSYTKIILLLSTLLAFLQSTGTVSVSARLGLTQHRHVNTTGEAVVAGTTIGVGGSNNDGVKLIDEIPSPQRMCHADLSKNPAPQVVVAGSAKSGSTALYSKLCTHPHFECGLATKKEPNALRAMNTGGNSTTKQLYGMYLAKAFRGRRPGRGNLTVDGSIWYYYYPDSRMLLRRLLPCSKLLFLVRNPVHRARSNYYHSGVPGMSFDEYIQMDTHMAAVCNRLVGQTWKDMTLGLQSRFFKCLTALVKRFRGRRRRNDFISVPHPLAVGYWIYHIQELRRRHAVHALVYDDFENEEKFGGMLDGLTDFLGITRFEDKSLPPKTDINEKGARTSTLFAQGGRASLHRRTVKRMKPVLELQTAALEHLLGRSLGWRFDSAGTPRTNTTTSVLQNDGSTI